MAIKRFLAGILSICWVIANGQVGTITGKIRSTNDVSMGLDTNKVAIDELGNRLHFYQYRSLLTSGQYGISSIGPNGPMLNEYRLIKRDDNQTLQLYEMVKKQIAIKSTMLEEGNKLSVEPLRTIDPAKFDNKAIVLMFLSPDCEPCMSDMPELSSFLKTVDPNKMVLVALARGDESPETHEFFTIPIASCLYIYKLH